MRVYDLARIIVNFFNDFGMTAEDTNSIIRFSLPSDPSHSIAICLLGGTIVSWIANGKEQLYLSPLSELSINAKKPIRGGIPLVFPVFGKKDPFPLQHGFARNLPWKHEWTLTSFDKLCEDNSAASDSEENEEGDEYNDENIVIQISLKSTDLDSENAALFPYDFEVYLLIKLYKNALKTTFQVHNLPSSNQVMAFDALLHTYLKVDDISAVSIEGLHNTEYLDKVRKGDKFVADRESIAISGETDRVYVNAPNKVILKDASHTLTITKDGFSDYVVWNPWQDKAAAMTDFPDDGYKNMACIEAGSVSSPVLLASGHSWEATQVIVNSK